MLSKSLVAVVLGALLCTPILAESVDYRLPPEIQPTAQSIELTLDPSKTDFTASTVLQLEIASDVERIGIYQIDLNMTAIQLSSDSGERMLQAEIGEYDMNWLSDGKTIPAGEYELSIEYNGNYSTDALGMHRTRFEDNEYIFTQMEACNPQFRRAVFQDPLHTNYQCS